MGFTPPSALAKRMKRLTRLTRNDFATEKHTRNNLVQLLRNRGKPYKFDDVKRCK